MGVVLGVSAFWDLEEPNSIPVAVVLQLIGSRFGEGMCGSVRYLPESQGLES